MNLVQRIAGAARLLATGKLALNTGFDGAQMQRRLMTWRAGGESINSLILQGGELQRARARQLVRTNPYASNAAASFTAHAVGCGIKPSSLVEDGALKDQIQRLWLAWTDEADADGLTDFYGLQAMAARAMFEAGECFLRFRPRRPDDGLAVPLQLQMLSSEHLPLAKYEISSTRRAFAACSSPVRSSTRRCSSSRAARSSSSMRWRSAISCWSWRLMWPSSVGLGSARAFGITGRRVTAVTNEISPVASLKRPSAPYVPFQSLKRIETAGDRARAG